MFCSRMLRYFTVRTPVCVCMCVCVFLFRSERWSVKCMCVYISDIYEDLESYTHDTRTFLFLLLSFITAAMFHLHMTHMMFALACAADYHRTT